VYLLDFSKIISLISSYSMTSAGSTRTSAGFVCSDKSYCPLDSTETMV